MDAISALDTFLQHSLDPAKGIRYCDLIQRPKGQNRFLRDLYHRIGDSFRDGLPNTSLNESQKRQPGFSFSVRRGFGVAEASIQAGYDTLMPDTGWLLIDESGKFGIYQPEDMIDEQRQIIT